MRGQVADAAHRLADRAERGLVAVWPVLPVAGDARDHQPGIDRVQRIRGQPRRSSPPARRFSTSTSARAASFRHGVTVALQVQYHGQLVAAVHAEPYRVPLHRSTPAAERIAAWRLELDHLGTEVGQDAGTERSRDVMADLEHLQAGEWTGAFRWNRHLALQVREIVITAALNLRMQHAPVTLS